MQNLKNFEYFSMFPLHKNDIGHSLFKFEFKVWPELVNYLGYMDYMRLNRSQAQNCSWTLSPLRSSAFLQRISLTTSWDYAHLKMETLYFWADRRVKAMKHIVDTFDFT